MKFKPFFKIEKLLKECTVKKKSSESFDSVLNTLLNSLLSDLKMTADEKALYLAVYNTTIRKNIFEAKVVKEPENTKQSEFAMV